MNEESQKSKGKEAAAAKAEKFHVLATFNANCGPAELEISKQRSTRRNADGYGACSRTDATLKDVPRVMYRHDRPQTTLAICLQNNELMPVCSVWQHQVTIWNNTTV